MDSPNDSGDDLFITQSTFRVDTVDTQVANEAANFFLDSDDDILCTSFENLKPPSVPDTALPEVVEYVDFSNDTDKGYTLLSTQEYQEKKQSEIFEPILPNLFHFYHDKETDDVLAKVADDLEKQHITTSHFGERSFDEQLADKALKSYSPATKKKCEWVYRIFTDWRSIQNADATSKGKSLIPDLMLMDKKQMAAALCPFILEVRKQNGTNYPSQTLYEIVISLQLYMAMYGHEWKLLDDLEFIKVKNTLDNRMKELANLGFVAPRIQAEEIGIDKEDYLWKQGVLGESTPRQLVNTLLYMIGIHFALRAGAEHRNLRLGVNSQFAYHYDDQVGKRYLQYTEDSSKNNQGGINQRKVKRKCVRAYENTANPQRCLVRLFNKYMMLRPAGVTDFYLRPLNSPKPDCWFSCQPIGRQTLGKVVNSLLGKVGSSGKITNHSLRATAASRLYQHNVDEQLIQERTGHCSDSVRSYKRTDSKQLHEISEILYGNEAEAPPPKRRKMETEECVQVDDSAENCSDTKNSKLSFNFTINVNK